MKAGLLKDLTGPLQFEKAGATAAVEAAVAALLSVQPQQQQHQQQQQQHKQQQQTEASALQQLLESCQDFIALNTTDEGLLPPHFSPAGKQIEIRCQSASSPQQQEQKEQQQQQQQQQQEQDEKSTQQAMHDARKRFSTALKAIICINSEEAPMESLLSLSGALNSLCTNTGLHAVAADVLEQQQEQQKQGRTAAEAAAAAAGALSDACAAVAAAAAAIVGACEDKERSDLLKRLGGPKLFADAAVVQRVNAVSACMHSFLLFVVVCFPSKPSIKRSIIILILLVLVC